MGRRVMTDEFIAESADGRRFQIIEYTEYINAGPSGDPNAEIEGLKELLTSGGGHVNVNPDGTYEIVALRLLVRRT